ncbi:DNA polymerase III subunit alpha [Sphingosinicella sp. BN140058]|uniref:DNA polymerase III subunit alpha n=1 Tax=Sphingosinicella sp. BN140058 TaxID=1892855 RepID=UPI00101349F5|nr:DNA polymerase III subunit alpha [Sphingosinicella sp. BN140058]QAY78598.1 DNA polymerase III subunit alpha [Sphingosinicella sp. BN140058]
MSAPYVPLRIFSCYTMLEGAIEPKAIAKQAKKLDLPAAALTDRNGLYAAMAFTDACKGEGVQPVVGTMLGLARPGTPDGKPPIIDWLALYAQTSAGYDNLCALVSAAHLDRPVEEEAHVRFDFLEGRTEGLIALTAGAEGALARLIAEGQDSLADDVLGRLESLFPNRLYIELSRRGDAVEEKAEARLIDLAYARNLPLVATNPARFVEPHFHQAHDAMLCIAQSSQIDRDDRRKSSPEAWMKPAAEMRRLFEDLPEAIENTAVVARRCAVGAPKRKPILPSVAGDLEGEARQLREDAYAGLEKRLAVYPDLTAEQRQVYLDRLEFEIKIIVGMGFPGYFLIVADFIKWAKDNDIPVGPGRGSGAGSAVAWALTITDLDPLRLGLLFERFLNPERVSMPDFDIDFCETRRGEVIRYVQQRYGADKVAQIITFGKLKARAVLKDTGRVLQMSYGQVDRLAKLIPNHPTDPWTLDRALNGVSELAAEYKGDAQVRRLFDLAMKLEGLPRHSSTHAAGVVIGDRRLDALVPLYRDPRSDMPVTQFDMKYVEGAGLVKFDFLGLKTLSVLQKAAHLLRKRGIDVAFDTLAWDDEEVYKLLQRGETVGVFQLESEGMRRTLAAVKPTNFEDIIALVSLYRPGPMDNIPTFGARKNGREPIEYPHALLENVLRETYGIFVYQEQVMEAAKVLAGYSLGEADLLRRAMGKKIKAEMDAQRERFVTGCKANQIDKAKANELFDLIDKFAGYGFNKSHAAAYALVAYQTAWLKAHYPVEFYAASMCFDMHQTDKLAIFVDDMRRLEIECLPPCVNASEAEFDVEPHGEGHAVRYALGALKGVGEKAMEQLVDERKINGRFKSLDDFAERVDPRLLNRRQIESLAAGGAFDALAPNRAAVFAAAETILAHASSAAEARTSGQGGLFGGESNVVPIRMPVAAAWSMAESMAAEKEAFGFYFSAHPVDRFRHLAEAHGARSFGAYCAMPAPPDGGRSNGVMAGMVEDARWRTSARGRRYLMATMSDASGQFVATCFEDDVAERLEEAAKSGACALLTVELDRRPGDETPRVTIKQIQLFETLSKRARLQLEVEVADEAALRRLAEALASERGGVGDLRLRARFDGGQAEVLLGRDFKLDADLAARIERLPGIVAVNLSAAPAPRLALVS